MRILQRVLGGTISFLSVWAFAAMMEYEPIKLFLRSLPYMLGMPVGLCSLGLLMFLAFIGFCIFLVPDDFFGNEE